MDLERIVHEVMRVCRFVLQDVRTCTRGSRNARKSKATAIYTIWRLHDVSQWLTSRKTLFMTSAIGWRHEKRFLWRQSMADVMKISFYDVIQWLTSRKSPFMTSAIVSVTRHFASSWRHEKSRSKSISSSWRHEKSRSKSISKTKQALAFQNIERRDGSATL